MNPWICALLISLAGMVGGVVNALLTDNKFIVPKLKNGILCPGFLSNILIGATSAFSSWSFYGSGASIELAKTTATVRQDISLTFSALAGAFLVGVAGAKWLTNEVDKRLLKESVKEAAKKEISPDKCDKIITQSPRKILEEIQQA
ncbi:hypothetical protein [Mucilaginibacter sp. SJ]|uniref:hypothetical protein n=1 Tax=Mucilaginibacter sp. SJ TaxID=3029053 RepID=UPI0023A951CE|nr:hypothetical protein [Mucilaginibacter sp. SJ]WEA00092.1 hypothetical protein MusilaSJ_21790 [Mucilaginibacter sp. SJ]